MSNFNFTNNLSHFEGVVCWEPGDVHVHDGPAEDGPVVVHQLDPSLESRLLGAWMFVK